MSRPLTRREMLRRSTLAAAGVAGGLAGGLAPSIASAIQPIARTGKPKFKFSLAAYSYRNLLTGDKPELTLDDFVTDCAKFGLEGTELTSYYFPKEPEMHELQKLKQKCFQLGLDISGTAVGNDFCHPEGEKRNEQIDLVTRWIDYADIMGIPVIRIFSGSAKKDQSPDEAHKLAVEGIEECCQHAGDHGVYLALENHGGLTTEVDGMLKLVRDVKSPWFGVNVDTGNFRSTSAYEDLAKIAPYAVNVQVKVVMQLGPGAKAEPADFKRLAGIMTDAAYRGYIVLEYEEKEDPREACPRYLDELRKAFGA